MWGRVADAPGVRSAQNYGPPDLCSPVSLSVRIVLASVLKPVTDPRLLARLGRTLAELPDAEVHIVAHVAADAPTARPDTLRANVFLHPIFDFPRLSLARALASRTLLRHLQSLQPDVLVVGAAELLPAGVQWQHQTGGQLVYDVRENYALNVRTQGVFPPLVAGRLAARIERMEAAAAPHLAGALLAERVYATQLSWLKECRRVAIIENKYQPTSPIPNPPLRKPLTPDRPVRLLVSGTLSELYGTFDAIDVVQKLRDVFSQRQVELLLIGHAPRAADAYRLRALALDYPWLRLEGIEAPVPHAAIVAAIRRADIGLLPYRPHPSLDGCIPTKLWEYVGESLPVVMPEDLREGLSTNAYIACVMYSRDFALSPDGTDGFSDFSKSIAHAALWLTGNNQILPPPDAFWSTEATRLLDFFNDLRQA